MKTMKFVFEFVYKLLDLLSNTLDILEYLAPYIS